MTDIVKICKKHGELKEEDTRKYIYKGYQCRNCRICLREYDRKRSSTEKRKEQNRIRSRNPENKIKARAREIAYKERRRVVNRELYHSKKNDVQFREKIKKNSNASYQRMKESFNDSYVKKILRIYKDATPEIIENKRLQIIEYRSLIKENKLKREVLIKQRKELIEDRKLRGIVKYCKIHGELTEEYTWFVKNGTQSLNKIHICITCAKKSSKESYINNFEKIKKRNKDYAVKNKEQVLERTRQWSLGLADKYVQRFFIKNSNITPEHITYELLDLKRALILLKRKLLEIKNGGKEYERTKGESFESSRGS